ncbi:MAG TPA: RdgB/HAM1 family non-canonical purine NTP pyrophosphatase [Candidatus Bilophila faecipullorum]|uniref:dITP/XTP pyrophosphatase n=1 Tax=Candidatus Bilophila faecipullorum TaxID=2838482 RepID=A0A9D1R2G9_9BACT|nr:RdgB/HAM1 family non-canonical purine NTP pyrophosphatase [uncultured Bilophila sp.]HIW79238.1 RdgB/HAM1 family non-canonical purine NTP pyrophosphatase [Candidatus Bilophila faecipullorum]
MNEQAAAPDGAVTIVLATRNKGKVREMEEPLRAFGLRVVGLDAFPDLPEVEETGATFEENALLKARDVARRTGLLAIADDSGLEVDALDGAPGVRSARYSDDMPDLPGESKDERNVMKLLAVLSSARLWQRSARFRTVIAACTPEGDTLVAPGTWEGSIACSPRGKNGFGYDPVFLDPELGRTAAELSREEKMARSHRGNALRELLRLWPAFWERYLQKRA